MTTDISTNNGHIAFSNDVRGDVEEASPVAKDLSQSQKAWDIDGDGKLDPTELALKDIDKTGKGTLSKDQMYHLMNESLVVKKELKKVKKFVIGLVVITTLLALANVGVSFAAAYLAKDTKTVEGKLVVSSSGETVKTDSTTEVFMVDTDLQERVRRERRLSHGCRDGACGSHDYIFPYELGSDIISRCMLGGSVSIGRLYTDADGAMVRTLFQICPAPPGTSARTVNLGEEESGKTIWGMTIAKDAAPDITFTIVWTDTMRPDYYVVDGLGELGDTCTETSHDILNDCGANKKCEKANPDDAHGICVPSIGHSAVISCNCGSNLVCNGGICKGSLGHDCSDFDHDIENHCDANLKCERVPGQRARGWCVRSIGHACTEPGDCGKKLICDEGKCKGDGGHGCKNPDTDTFKGEEDLCFQGGKDFNSYSCMADQRDPLGYGTCQCTQDSCGGDGEVCTKSDGCTLAPDGPQLCRNQTVLDDSCMVGTYCSVTRPSEYRCVREEN